MKIHFIVIGLRLVLLLGNTYRKIEFKSETFNQCSASNLTSIVSLTLLSIVLPYSSEYNHNATTIDVLQSEDAPNKFFFYEVYQDADAIAHHKLQPHYLAWGEFKESGGTLSSVSS
jgi:hypothetical protein